MKNRFHKSTLDCNGFYFQVAGWVGVSSEVLTKTLVAVDDLFDIVELWAGSSGAHG